MMPLNKQSPVPLYLQLKRLLEQQIASGMLVQHSRVPSERELSDTFQISRMTARQALTELIQEGRLYTRPGKGTFVAEQKITQSLQALTGYTEDMRQRGLSPSTRVLQRELVEAQGLVAAHLQTAEGAQVVCIRRLRLANDEPMALETAFLSFPGAEELAEQDFAGSLYALLQERFGITPTEAIQEFEAMPVGPLEGEWLHLREGTPVLRIQRTTFDSRRQPFEYVQSFYRGDRYCFTARLVRDGGALGQT